MRPAVEAKVITFYKLSDKFQFYESKTVHLGLLIFQFFCNS